MLRILTFLCWTGLLVSATSQEAAQPALQAASAQSNASVLPSVPALPPQNAPAQPSSLPQPSVVLQPPKSEASEAAQPPRLDAEAHVAPRKPAEAPKPLASSARPETAKTEASSTESAATTATQSSSTASESTTVTSRPTQKTSTTTEPASTTVKPASTTVEPATSTAVPPAPPAPLPPAKTGKWVVNETGQVCVVAQMAAQFDVGYLDANKTKSHVTFNLPADQSTRSNGSCGRTEQNLTLSWLATGAGWNNLTLHFVKNDSDKHYALHHLELSMPAEEFPNGNFSEPVVLMLQKPAFSTGLNNSYRCLMQQKLALKTPGSNDTSAVLTVSDLQFQAFKTGNSTVFDLAKDCAFDTPDVVPIVVGCALAGLVVVVLIAYLVGRRRSQGQGYVSM